MPSILGLVDWLDKFVTIVQLARLSLDAWLEEDTYVSYQSRNVALNLIYTEIYTLYVTHLKFH